MNDRRRRAMFASMRERMRGLSRGMTQEEKQDLKRAAAMIGIGVAGVGGAVFAYNRAASNPAVRATAVKAGTAAAGTVAASTGTLIGDLRQYLSRKKAKAKEVAGRRAEDLARAGGTVAAAAKLGARTGAVKLPGAGDYSSPETLFAGNVDFAGELAEDYLRTVIENHATNLQHQAARLIGKTQQAANERMLERVGKTREGILRRGGRLAGGGDLTPEERKILEGIRERIREEGKALAVRRDLRRTNRDDIREAIAETRRRMFEGQKQFQALAGQPDATILKEELEARGLAPTPSIWQRANEGFRKGAALGSAFDEVDV